MSAVFKPDETFRDDFTFRNSPQAIRRFPLPFPEDTYMYSVNIEPHLPGPSGSVTEFAFDVDEHYVAECRERAIVLEKEPLRYQALPHMMSSQWDCLELIMESLAGDYPAHFSLAKRGNRWHWINRPLGIGSAVHLRRCRHPAAGTLGLHHSPGTGRLRGDGSARGRSVGRGRHGDDPGRLVPGFRHWHELQGMARSGAAGARDAGFRPGAEIPAQSSSRVARETAQLDHDRPPPPRYLAGKLSALGT